MIDDKFGVKVEPDDPNRCQSGGKHGQCPYAAKPGMKYCPRHSGMTKDGVEEQSKRAYMLTKWQMRVNEFADHDQVKSLREEVGITRMLLEVILNKCDDSNDLLIHSGKIADLVTRIEKLVTSCHRLEASTGMLMDKSAAIHIAAVMVEIVTRYVEDEDAIERISTELITAISDHKPEIKKQSTPS